MDYLDSIKISQIKQQISSTLSDVVLLCSNSLMVDNEEYLLYVNSLLDVVVKNLLPDNEIEDEE